MAWTIDTTWDPIDTYDVGHTQTYRDTWPDARRYALRLACLKGIRYIEVTDPDGRVAATYERADNTFRLTDVGKAAGGHDRAQVA